MHYYPSETHEKTYKGTDSTEPYSNDVKDFSHSPLDTDHHQQLRSSSVGIRDPATASKGRPEVERSRKYPAQTRHQPGCKKRREQIKLWNGEAGNKHSRHDRTPTTRRRQQLHRPQTGCRLKPQYWHETRTCASRPNTLE